MLGLSFFFFPQPKRLLPRRRRHHTRVVGRAPTEISGEEQFRSAKYTVAPPRLPPPQVWKGTILIPKWRDLVRHFAPAARADSLMVLHSAAVDARLRQCIAADLSYWRFLFQ
uniref:Uncharacterized protein n=2 Tax=Oryza TaxID=4527 RepID=A0A0D3GVX7_9ORYZ